MMEFRSVGMVLALIVEHDRTDATDLHNEGDPKLDGLAHFFIQVGLSMLPEHVVHNVTIQEPAANVVIASVIIVEGVCVGGGGLIEVEKSHALLESRSLPCADGPAHGKGTKTYGTAFAV
jgi:hypothetical protein